MAEVIGFRRETPGWSVEGERAERETGENELKRERITKKITSLTQKSRRWSNDEKQDHKPET